MFERFFYLPLAHATLGAGFLTGFGAVIAVLLGSRMFNGKVASIETALEATEALLTDHQQRVQHSLADIEEKLAGLAANTAQLRADVSDQQAADVSAETSSNEPSKPAEQKFDDLKSEWLKIRDALEEKASNSQIDGRTAAKYARIDRRSYASLVSSMNRDGNLGNNGANFLEAANIWASYRSQKKAVTNSDLARMKELVVLLAGTE